MLEKPIITLTTDFGLKDPFVGIIKGVILEINPRATIIDISHSISPQNILEASQVISMSYKYFSPSAIHLVIVDPEVGSPRRPLLVVAEDYYFIGPDNGVFTHIFKEPHTNIFKVINISASHYYLPFRGPTFHGRDIFAPIAAWLSRGVESSRFGDPIKDYALISIPKPKLINKNSLEGEVIYIDSFGNAITNITEDFLKKIKPGPANEKIEVICKGKKMRLSNYYAEAVNDNISAVINSFGQLELFMYKGPASDKFNIKIGDKIKLAIE